MRKLAPFFFAAALGAAMVSSSGASYELAARALEINHTPAAELLKNRAMQEAMFAHSLERQELPVVTAVATTTSKSERG
jgi:hypothetical protein